MSDEERIRQLCAAWVSAAKSPDGSLLIGSKTEQYRLHQNGIEFHALDFDAIRAACLGLSEVLLLPGMNTVIDRDHQLFWSWIGQILLAPRADVFPPEERELSELFAVCIRASLAGIRQPASSREEWEEQNRRLEIVEANARELVHQSHLVLAFLALPLLEAMAKKVSVEYVEMGGTVLKSWTVPTGTYSPGARCSSIRDLLYLVRDTVATPELRADLEEMRASFLRRDPTTDAFDTIYAWRNQALHGQTSHPTIGGTVLNVAIRIALEFVSNDYDSRRDAQVEQCRWEQQTRSVTGHRSPWSYYPPW